MNLDITKKYRVKNLTDSIIVTVASGLNGRRREWLMPDAISYVTLEEIEEVMQTVGGKKIYENSLKVYADDDVLEHLGLKTISNLDTSDEALKELFALDLMNFEKRLQNYPKDVYSRIVKYAVKSNITDLNIIDILTDNTKMNVLGAIRSNRKESSEKPKATYEKVQDEKDKK